MLAKVLATGVSLKPVCQATVNKYKVARMGETY